MAYLRRGALAAAVLLLLGVSTALAQTTGRIVGTITDASGAALPGVTVTVAGPSLQGTATAVSDGTGVYRFPSLPPGTYTVTAALSGFKTVEQPNVVVGLDRTVDVNVRMEVAALQETVTVEATSPLVDTSSTTIGVSAKAELFTRLPVQRDFYSIARLAPGATEDAVGPAVLGSTGAENMYIIEGLNSTGIERAEKTKALNFDFVEEIEVKTGGLNAEYGRMTGGLVNVITKSGGNTFRGSLFGFSEGGGLQAENSTAADRPETTTTVVDLDRRWDVGLDVGGYIVRDKLWFFGAYNRVFDRNETEVIRSLNAPGAPAVGSEIPSEITKDLYAGKLTYKLTNTQTLTASIMGDPTEEDGNLFVVAGPESTWKGVQDTGGADFAARYDGVFGGTFLLRGLIGRHYEKTEINGAGKLIPAQRDDTVSPIVRTGGFAGYFQDSEFSRTVYKIDATKFLGSHEIKGGIDWEDQASSIDRYQAGGGILNYRLIRSGAIYYRHRFYVDDQAPGYVADDPLTFVPAVPLRTEPNTFNTSFYVQDSWRALPNLTINAGIRWERQEIGDRFGETPIDLTDNWAPRVGVIWDVTKNGRSKVFANWGRFFESIPMDINIRAFGGEVTCFCYNFDPNPLSFIPDPAAPARTAFFGGATPVDEALQGQYVDEFLAGVEFEVAPNLSVGAKYVRRTLGRVIEDFLVPSEGHYFIANPGFGLGREMSFYDYSPVPAPEVNRENNSFELSARKRFSEGWQFLASYVWSRLEGNYDGTFQVSTGQLDPNINSAFDYADFLVNADGRLTNDRTHQLKFDGSYEVQGGAVRGLNLALSTHWYSGGPLNAYGYSTPYANWEYYLVPRGSLGRGPSDWEADIHASYPIRLGATSRLNLVMDIFNLFDRQEAFQLDERYNLARDGRCAGIPEDLCNGDNGWLTTPGTLDPLGSLSDPRATAPNPDYLRKGVAFTLPRSIRFGVRFYW
ncbi:MAG TPA: TonB-dependent receptor [Vicinamibacterales bacterium]|nr:TonB-dependent receptor [Vicinamibacterales bacterium]